MRAVASLLSLLALGCAGSAPAESGASLELGTGTARFAPVADGEALPMIRGAQGGWHVWIAVRVDGRDVATGSLTFAQQPADESSDWIETRVGAVFDPPDAEGRRVSLGWPVIFADPTCSVGRLHRIRVTLTTASGERLVAEREILPTAGENPPPPCGTPLPETG